MKIQGKNRSKIRSAISFKLRISKRFSGNFGIVAQIKNICIRGQKSVIGESRQVKSQVYSYAHIWKRAPKRNLHKYLNHKICVTLKKQCFCGVLDSFPRLCYNKNYYSFLFYFNAAAIN